MSERTVPVAVDVGNSAVKIAIDSQTVRSFEHGDVAWVEAAILWVKANVDQRPCTWWVSSVNNAATDPLLTAIRSAGDRLEVVTADRIPIDIDVKYPQRVGRDRLLSAYAVASRRSVPAIVVDAGSAVTVDWVGSGKSGRPVFSGGAILPGLRLQLTALAAGTEAIRVADDVSLQNGARPFAPGKDTQQAIRLGAGAAVIGGIDRLVEEYFQHFGFCSDQAGAPSVLVTGGDAKIVSQFLKATHEVVPNLVCLGLLDIAELFAETHSEG